MLHEEQLHQILPIQSFNALKAYIQQYEIDSNVVGIFLTGSFVHGDAGPNADLDVVIVQKYAYTRTRGNIFVNNVEIEYFINPINQVEKYFEEEFPNKINTAHMYTNSIILYQNGSELPKLMDLAKNYIEKPLPDLSEYEIYSGRYFLDDLRKDLLDALDKNDKVTFDLVASEVVKELIKYFGKIKKIYPAKPKRIIDQFTKIDKTFANDLKIYLESSAPINERYQLLQKCISYIENLFGGSRPNDYYWTGPLSV